MVAFVGYFVFVASAWTHAGNKNFPYTGRVAQPHRMAVTIPMIEVAHDRDAACVGSPHRETNAVGVAHAHGVRSHDVRRVGQGPLMKRLQLAFIEQGTKGKGV